MITVDSQFPKIFPYGLGFLGAICIACILANIFFSIALGQINYIVEALSVNPNKIGMAQTQPSNRSFWGLHFWTCHSTTCLPSNDALIVAVQVQVPATTVSWIKHHSTWGCRPPVFSNCMNITTGF